MNLLVALGVGALGGLGAVARVLVTTAVGAHRFPYGTLAVNVSGAFAVGVLLGAEVGPDAARLAGTGLLGAYTTFSTWMLETRVLAREGRGRAAGANVAVSLVAGLIAAWAGREIGAAF
jgi:CrcB protein